MSLAKGPSRDLETARKAYDSKSVELSKAAHDAKRKLSPTSAARSADERHQRTFGDYIKSIVYGGLDGVITTFAIVTGVAGASLSADLVLVLGSANLVADAISMGYGDYLSELAQLDYAKSERKREEWEFQNYREGEIREMVEIYEKKGFSERQARLILETMAENPEFFVDHMCVQELELMPPDPNAAPAKDGLVTFLSFMAFGFVPLSAYLFLYTVDFGDSFDPTFLISVILTLATLAALGVLKGRISNSSMIRSALFTVVNGTIAAAASYAVGFVVGEIVGVKESH